MPDRKTGVEGTFEAVRGAGFLAGFSLALFRRGASPTLSWRPGGDLPPHFARIGRRFLEELMTSAVQLRLPQLSRTKTGLYCFAVPFGDGESPACIVGCGVRDASLDLVTVEKVARSEGVDPGLLLEELEALPVISFGSLAEVAARIMTLVRLLGGGDCGPETDCDESDRLRLVGELASELDRAGTAADTMALLAESIGLVFDLPGVAHIRPAAGNWQLQPLWGIEFEPSDLPANKALPLISSHKPLQLPPGDLAGLIPAAAGSRGAVIPLRARDRSLGALVLMGERFSLADLLLQDLLAGRGALRIALLEREQELIDRSLRTEQMFEIFNQLALIDDVTELSREFLDQAAGLVAARSGSLMLLDSRRDLLSIVAVRGMNPTVARNLTVRMGSGIAGQVAQSGNPLLVSDILADPRFVVGRRPRFKTGSFVSVPLCWKGETLGVLNLSDKGGGSPFGQPDLDLLTTLSGHVASLISRARTTEGARHLERLSITDPLTELYNRRFLERRMDEELARSTRHGLKLSVMMLDMDSFKLYNDLCGHQAGDAALRKVAAVLRRSVREMDVVTRYGGEEFCILLPDTPKIDAVYVAERIRYGIEQEFFPGEEGLPGSRMTVSIGIASFPENGTTAHELVSTADAALYQAKAEGRNRVVGSFDLPGARVRGFVQLASLRTH